MSSKAEGVNVKFLVDTGSNITILSPVVLEKISARRRPVLEEVKNRMILADGSAKPFHGKGTFKLEVEGKRALQEVWIADIERERILGMDFVRRYGCRRSLQLLESSWNYSFPSSQGEVELEQNRQKRRSSLIINA